MGAKGSVSVVQLIMKDTMEQELRSYVNSDKSKRGVATSNNTTAAAGLAGASSSTPRASDTAIGYSNCYPSPPLGPAQGAVTAGAVVGDARCSAAAVAADAGATPPPSRKRPREKSPWEGSGRKRARSGKKVPGRGNSSSSSSSSQQEHAKVHFLLTSLRSSKAAASAGGGEAGQKGHTREEEEEEAEEEVKEDGDAERSGWKGKGKGKGKAARRGVRFAEEVVVHDGEEGGAGAASRDGADSPADVGAGSFVGRNSGDAIACPPEAAPRG